MVSAAFDRKKYQQKYYQKNKEKLGAKNKLWRLTHPVRSNEISKRWKSVNLNHVLWKTAKARAKQKGVDFTIESSDVVIPEICPILKTPFEMRTMYAATIDRIIPERGYVPGNIQVISKKANMMKSNATEKEMIAFAKWVLGD